MRSLGTLIVPRAGLGRGLALVVRLGVVAGALVVIQAALLSGVVEAVFLGGADLAGVAFPLLAVVAVAVVRAGRGGRSGGGSGTGRGDEIRAPISGLLRGLIAGGSRVKKGQKIGDVDPRGRSVDPATISDKGRAVAGGVLEAIMHWWKGK